MKAEELNDHSSRERVALISTEDYAQYFTDLFAVWIAGLVAVPLSPQLPSDTIDRVYKEARNALYRRESFFPDVAMTQFTSGSTGAPKGVCLTLSGLSLNAKLTAKALSLGSADKLFINTPPNYMSALSHFLTMIAAGGSMVAYPGFFFGRDLAKKLKEHDCTGFGGAPSHLYRWTETVTSNECPSTLRFWMSSGDHLSEEVTLKAQHKFPQLKIFSMYGLTELSGRLCILQPSDLPEKAGSVGKPLPGMRVITRKNKKKECEICEVGQVYVEGPVLMRGYLGEKPIASEFPTGDWGYFDEDGFLWLEGRKDDVFKSGAEKVSLVKIQEAVLETGECQDSAVIAVDNDVLGRVPHAFVVPKYPRHFDVMHFLKKLKQQLPSSHIPKHISIVEEIPRTGSGKVVRDALMRLHETES